MVTVWRRTTASAAKLQTHNSMQCNVHSAECRSRPQSSLRLPLGLSWGRSPGQQVPEKLPSAVALVLALEPAALPLPTPATLPAPPWAAPPLPPMMTTQLLPLGPTLVVPPLPPLRPPLLPPAHLLLPATPPPGCCCASCCASCGHWSCRTPQRKPHTADNDPDALPVRGKKCSALTIW